MKTLEMMTGGGMNTVQELAEMIRKMGRGKDKVLAHITPEEAVMLKKMGGRGSINPMTGLPEFQDDLDQWFDDYYAQNPPGGGETSQSFPIAEDLGANIDQPSFNIVQNRGLQTEYRPEERSYLPSDSLQEMAVADQMASQEFPLSTREAPPVDETFAQSAERRLRDIRSTLDKYPNLTRLGAGAGSVLAQGLIASRANRQYRQMADEARSRAQPFRAAQTEAMGRATGAGLTPQQAQELETELARARQGLSARNTTTGSAAAGIQAGQRQRAQSLARRESFTEALRLANIADQYEARALEAELARDQQLSKLFADIVGRELQAATRTANVPQRG
jgi:hypothetical protein